MALGVLAKYDYVGSFLRPQAIKEARTKFSAGQISEADLHAVEDTCIKKLVEEQKAAGYPLVTDGEYRRAYWHLDFMWGLNGVEEIELEHGYQFHGEETAPGSIQLVGKIDGHNHPFVNYFKYVNSLAGDAKAKQTIPGPAQMLSELFRGKNGDNTRKYYHDMEELIQDIAKAYQTVISELYDAGCRFLQLDDCTWGMIADKDYWEAKVGPGISIDAEAKKYLRLNNLALEKVPADMTIAMHVCRGNYNSTYAATGTYDIVGPYLFEHKRVNVFYLEYDDERAGTFDVLDNVPEDKEIVLGLITTKRPELEDKDFIKARIADAAKHVPLERLSLSPQCGFASCEIGNKITEDVQWKKLALVKEIAEEVWGK